MFFKKQKQNATYTDGKDTFLSPYMYTGRKAAASEHQTHNLAITSPMRYRYTNCVCEPSHVISFTYQC